MAYDRLDLAGFLLGDELKPIKKETIVENEKFVDSLGFVISEFEGFELTESDAVDIEDLNIYEELSTIEEAMESIRDKMVLSESDVSTAITAATLIPVIAAFGAGTLGYLITRIDNGVIPVPRILSNLITNIGRFLTNANEKERVERRNVITNAILKQNPDLKKAALDKFIDDSYARAKKREEYAPANSAKHGTYETGFMKAQKQRDAKGTREERIAAMRKKFPNLA